ncbi:UNVERIFIED_CONTAM: hypothetical protein FKN15_040225 [Acipenser sinensis]
MARRVPMGLDQVPAAAEEMHATFLKNLTYAANVLLKEGILGLVEPINTRITDPGYFLNMPHQVNSFRPPPNTVQVIDYYSSSRFRGQAVHIPLARHIDK